MPRRVPDTCRLLFGPYRPPRLRVGDRATCLYRDCNVVITSWTDARISWPRCRALDGAGGGSGLLVDEELAGRCGTIRRKALGVGQWEPEGSRRLLVVPDQRAG